MDYTQDLYFAPFFDFSEFFKSGFLTDCEIHIHSSQDDASYTTVRAHRAVLANASDFFYNTFTSGMQEAETGVVDVHANPLDMLPAVINWMYDGRLDFAAEKAMAVLSIAHNYGITVLEREVVAYIKRVANKETIPKLIQQCFDAGLSEELQALEPIIAEHIKELSIAQLSEALDVTTFAHVIGQCKMPNAERIAKIQEFLGDWNASPEEKAALGECLAKEPGLRALLQGKNYSWLPDGYERLIH